VSAFGEQQREALRDDAMAAAKRCINMVVEGDPEATPNGFASADRKNNAQAAMFLVQAASAIERSQRR
jgi:hypothetical protein